jgi:transcriptional regulator with XRE-family HTH domain
VSTETPTTGLDLKVERTRAQVTGKAVAEAMGVSSSRLSRIERDEPVTDRMRKRYLKALETCRTSGTRIA